MAIIINYTKKDYLAKIAELEGYDQNLKTHLETLKGYKEQMFNFWDDPDAQKTGQALVLTIHQVERTMQQTEEMLTFYRSVVEKLGGVGTTTNELLEKALGLLGGLG